MPEPLSPQRELQVRRRLERGKLTDAEELRLRRLLEQGEPTFGEVASQRAGAVGMGAMRGLANVAGLPVEGVKDVLNIAGSQMGALEPSVAPFRAQVEERFGPNPYIQPGQFQPIREAVGDIGSMQRGAEAAGLTVPIEDVPRSLMPWFKGGEVVGESLPFAAAPQALAARTGLQAPILEAVRRAPATFAGVEASQTGAAALGRGVAEQVLPGNELAGTAAEVGAALFSPYVMFTRVAPGLTNQIRQAWPNARATRARAGRQIAGILKETGEDVDDVVKALRAPSVVPGARPTAGMKSGSVGLLAIERKVAGSSAKMNREVGKQVAETIAEFNAEFRRAMGSGDPGVVRQALQARRQYLLGLVDANMEVAQNRAREASRSIASTDIAARTTASRRASTLLDDAMRTAREAETSLYEQIPKDLKFDVNADRMANLETTLREMTIDLLPGETLNLPGPVKNALRGFMPRQVVTAGGSAKRQIIRSGDLLRIRKSASEKARVLSAGTAPERDMARRLNKIAAAITNDLAERDPIAATARDFSIELNDRLTRGPVGTVRQRSAAGGPQVPPELVLEQTVGRGGIAGDVSAEAMQRAVEPPAAYVPEAGRGIIPQTGREVAARPGEMRAVQEAFLREQAGQLIEPRGAPFAGMVTNQAAEKFISRNRELMNRFPFLARAIRESGETQLSAARVAQRAKRAQKVIQQHAALRRADIEDAPAFFNDVLRSPTARGDMEAAFKQVTRRGGQAGRDGARVGLMQAMMERSTRSDGLLDGGKFLSELEFFNVEKLGKKYGILNQGQVDRLKAVAEEARRAAAALDFRGSVDQVIDEPNAILDLMVRSAGAQAARISPMAQGAGAGPSLIISHAGSKQFQRLFERIPASKTLDFIREASESPEVMAALLEKVRTEKQAMKIVDRIEKWILSQPNAAFMQAAISSE